MYFLQLITKAKNVFIRIPGAGAVISNGLDVVYSEHNCGKDCVANFEGSDEAFIAGVLLGKVNDKRFDDCLELGNYAMISALKSTGTVNQNLSEKYIERLQQQNFVSYREIYIEKKEDLEGVQVEEEKKEL